MTLPTRRAFLKTAAGAAAIVLASPTPFTPSGFDGDGVSVWCTSIGGSIVLFGIA